jgi:O-antigen ligase
LTDVQLVAAYAIYIILISLVHFAESPILTVIGLGVYLSYTLLFILALIFLGIADIERIAKILVFYIYPVVSVGAILSIFSSNPLVASSEIAYLGTSEQTAFDALRATSFTGSSLHLGLYNAMLLPLALGYLTLKEQKGRLTTLWLIFVFSLGIISLLLSFSRGAWVQTFISLAVVAVFARRKITVGTWGLIGLGILMLTMVPAVRENTGLWMQRMQSITDWTSSAGNISRITIWTSSIDKFTESYFMGFGPSSTGNAPVRFGLASIATVTESSYIKLLLELGIIGFVLFVGLYYRFTALAFRLIKLVDFPSIKWLSASIAAVLIGLAAEMAIYQSIETQIVQGFLWFYLAALPIIYREITRKHVECVGAEHTSTE